MPAAEEGPRPQVHCRARGTAAAERGECFNEERGESTCDGAVVVLIYQLVHFCHCHCHVTAAVSKGWGRAGGGAGVQQQVSEGAGPPSGGEDQPTADGGQGRAGLVGGVGVSYCFWYIQGLEGERQKAAAVQLELQVSAATSVTPAPNSPRLDSTPPPNSAPPPQAQTEECNTLSKRVEAMSDELSAARDARRALLQEVHSKHSAISRLVSQLAEVNHQLGKVAED